MNASRKRITPLLKALLGVSLLLFLLLRFDFTELVWTFRDADLLYLFLSLVFALLMVATSCWKWWLILRYLGQPIPFHKLYIWYFVGYFYSNILPSNVGGDVVRAWHVKQACKSGSVGVMSVFAERMSGVFVLLFLGAVLPLTHGSYWRHPAVWVVMSGAIVAFVGAGLLFMLRRQIGDLCAPIVLWVTENDVGAFRRFRKWGATLVIRMDAVKSKGEQLIGVLRDKPLAVVWIFALSFLFYGMTLLNVALAYRAFGPWPPILDTLVVLPIALLVAMVPVSLGNLGIAEGAYVFYFGLVGMQAELTLAMGLFLRMKVFLLGMLGLYLHVRQPAFESHGNRLSG